MKHFAYCDRSGTIDFGTFVPEGRLPIASIDHDQARLRETVETVARHAYDGETLLVPGIPEADTSDQALEALHRFNHMVADRLAQPAELPELGEHPYEPPVECEECGGSGIAASYPSHDFGDGEGEDRPCPTCSA